MQVAVELENMQLLVVLKLLRAVFGNLDDGAKDLRAAIADGEFKVIDHFLPSP
jgi:hypothetical protein